MIERLALMVRLLLVTMSAGLSGSSQRLRIQIFNEFMTLGGVYHKFLQLLVLQGRVFEDVRYERQLSVFDQLNYDKIDILDRIKAELPNSNHLFAYVDPNPFAAGSFAQVYRAKLHTGEEVVIKALRPNLKKTLHFDMRILRFASSLLNLFSVKGMVDVKSLFSDFEHMTLLETDYNREVAQAVSQHSRYVGHPYLVIPKTFAQLSSDSIITQEYIDGLALTDVSRAGESGLDPAGYVSAKIGSSLHSQLQTLGFTFLNGVFAYGSVHGDPHPGNVILLPENRVALIDFGIICEAPKNKSAFFELIKTYRDAYEDKTDLAQFGLSFFQFFGGRLYDALIKLDDVGSHQQHLEIVRRSIDKELQRYGLSNNFMTELVRSGRVSEFFAKRVNDNNKFEINLTLDAGPMVRASIIYNNLLDRLGCREEVMPGVYGGVVKSVESNLITYPYPESSLDYTTAKEIVSEWLDDLATSHPALFEQLNRSMKYA